MATNVARCQVCKSDAGLGASVTLDRPRGVEKWYLCAACEGRVVDVLYGRDRARV